MATTTSVTEWPQVLRIARLALAVAADELPAYSNPKSQKRFTQPQLLACLVVRAYLQLTYRGMVELLRKSEKLRQALGLTQVPNYSTLQRFAERVVTPEMLERLLARLLERVGNVFEQLPAPRPSAASAVSNATAATPVTPSASAATSAPSTASAAVPKRSVPTAPEAKTPATAAKAPAATATNAVKTTSGGVAAKPQLAKGKRS
ncbi:MAG: transposase [Gemmataceae bacterium]|nr:transposase [Gemmataceae bacterium]MCS7270426.1 transposase [Gemmataceae bacterium]MDW8244624.1 transposase [Thermogemmata sp.]